MNKQTVTTGEIANWVYCPEAWRLDALGLVEAAKQPARDAGAVHHAHNAVAERIAGSSIKAGWWLIALAILALTLLAVFGR